MLTLQAVLGVIAVLLGLFGYVFYIRGIIQGKVKPHAFSWFVWGLLTVIALFAQIAGGGGPGVWVMALTALFCFIFTVVGLTKSSRLYIKKSDLIFFIAAILTIPVWYFSGDPVWSIIIITVIDLIAFIPTMRKAYLNPNTENARTYTLSGIKFVVSIFALEAFSLTTALYPVSLIVTNFVLVAILVVRRRTLGK